jgi:hypothetical protein
MKGIAAHLKVPWSIRQSLWVFIAAWFLVPVVIVVGVELLAPVLPGAAELLKALSQGSIEANFGLDLISTVAALGLVASYLRRYDLVRPRFRP